MYFHHQDVLPNIKQNLKNLVFLFDDKFQPNLVLWVVVLLKMQNKIKKVLVLNMFYALTFCLKIASKVQIKKFLYTNFFYN